MNQPSASGRATRVAWIDVVKYVCIMCVMLSHLESRTEFLHRVFSPFFLNGFFFASGYVYRHKEGFGAFLAKKSRGLFFPWLVFSVFNIVLSQILTFQPHAGLAEELKWNFLQIRNLGDGLWFLAALFVAFIPFYFFIGRYEKSVAPRKAAALLAVCFLLSVASNLYLLFMDPHLLPWGSAKLPWHLEYIFVGMFWMVLGYLFRQRYEVSLDGAVGTGAKLGIVAVFLALVYVPWCLDIAFSPPIAALGYSYLCAFTGVFALVCVGKTITPNRHMLYIGQNTLLCFALHGKTFTVMQVSMRKVCGSLYAAILGHPAASSVFAICLAVVLSWVLVVPIYAVNRWMPFLVGRGYRR